MASERQPPDALLGTSGYQGTPTLADIDEDPDSGDANWHVAVNNNTNTESYVSYGTPTGNPTVGADLQEFRAQVRKFSGSGTGTPTARIELWENGSLVRAGTDANVTSSSGQVISFTWNANELATADGSLVECKVIGTKSGGSPSARSSVDVGAVEWNVEYDTGTTYAGAGTFSGSATLSGNALRTADGAGTFTGNATLGGDALRTAFGAGTFNGTGNLTGDALRVQFASGVFTGSGVLSADAVRIADGAGAFVCTGLLTGDGIHTALAQGVAAGSAVLSADALRFADGAGSFSATGTLAGNALRTAFGSGAANSSVALLGVTTLTALAVTFVNGIAVLSANANVIGGIGADNKRAKWSRAFLHTTEGFVLSCFFKDFSTQ